MNTVSKMVHISVINSGDTVRHNGQLRTVCLKDKGRGFFGRTLFGDSYQAGRKLVERVDIIKAMP